LELAKQELKESLESDARNKFITREVGRYSGLIHDRVKRVWRVPHSSQEGQLCIVKLALSPTGEVLSASITQSSGDPGFDNSALSAVRQASPLPISADPDVAAKLSSFNLKLRRED